MSVVARHAQEVDLPAIRELAASGEPLLHEGNVDFLTERGVLTLVAEDEDGALVGYMSLFDTPGEPLSNQNGEGAKWVNEEAKAMGYTTVNTVWVQQCVVAQGSQAAAARALLHEAFCALTRVSTIAAASARDVPVGWGLKGLMEKVSFNINIGSIPVVMLAATRAMVVPPLLVRRARVEDHDDLLPVLERARGRLGALAMLPDSTYPDEPFALARLISSQEDGRHVLVAENPEGRLVGMMALTTEVDVRGLQAAYELEPYDGLVEPSEDESLPGSARTEKPPEPGPAAPPPRPPPPPAEGEEEEGGAEPGEEEGEGGYEGGEGLLLHAPSPPVHLDSTAELAEEDEGGPRHTPPEGAEEEEEDLGPPPPSTAFAVSMLCLDAEYAAQGAEFLAPALDCFPDKSYIVLTLPNDSPEPLMLRVFSRIPTRPLSGTPEVFYLFHRYALLTSFDVRAAQADDVSGVAELVRGFPNQKDIFDSFQASLESETAMVALCEGEVVGFATLVSQVDLAILRSNFALEEYIRLEHHEGGGAGHAEVDFFVINPIFAHKRRLFLLEIMRLLGRSVLYFAMPAGESVPDVLASEFFQVPGRHNSSGPGGGGAGGAGADGVDFALYCFTHRLSAHFRTSVNARVVVVGSSDTALALLERLLLDRRLSFNYLTLVSPDGFAVPSDGSSAFTPSLLAKLGIPTRVRLVDRWMVGLDREARCIVLDDGTQVPYESLVVATGLQDQTRARLDLDPDDPYPVVALSDVLEMDKDEVEGLGSAIVYGATAEAYAASAALVDRGMDPAAIAHVVPPGSGGGAVGLLRAAAEREGAAPPEVLKLVAWEGAEAGVSVVFEAEAEEGGQPQGGGGGDSSSNNAREDEGRAVRQAGLLVACDEPGIDIPLFHCLNDASIVYDGAVVVDASFHTNDEHVFAAGTVAKFSRRYGRGLMLRHFNSREVGRVQADVLAALYSGEGAAGADGLEGGGLPTLRAAKRMSCKLPGGKTFAYAALPSVFMAPAGATAPPGGKMLVDAGAGLTMALDDGGFVVSLEYCGPLRMDANKLAALVGLHSAYFNGAVDRHLAGEREDLLAAITEPWSDALYLDRFAAVRAGLLSQAAEEVSDESGGDLGGNEEGVKGLVQDVVLDLVFQHAADLPRYNLPGVGG